MIARALSAVLRERGQRIRDAEREVRERLAKPERRKYRPRAVPASVARSQSRRAREAALRERLRAELGYSGVGRRHPGAVVWA